jgi:two-component system sensor histidine kinase UhpB
MPLIWRVLLGNAAVLAAAALLLALTPLTVSTPPRAEEAAALAAGALVMLAVDFVLLRHIFRPLHALSQAMRTADPLQPGARVQIATSEPEIGAVADSFNAMVKRLEDERRGSARRAIVAQEAERLRVSRELHDEIGQLLTGVLLRLSSVASHVPAGARGELESAREDVRRSMDEVRTIAQQLRPPVLETLGLPSALDALADDVERQAAIHVERDLDDRVTGLPDELEVVVYRIAQESLTNVVRHAGTPRASLRLGRDAEAIVLEVSDAGAGFDPGAAAETAGLTGMRERALLTGGRLTVASRPGGGTRVRLTVPDPADAR